MIVVKEGSTYKVECFMGEKVSGHRPSIDVLFESVSKVCGQKRNRYYSLPEWDMMVPKDCLP